MYAISLTRANPQLTVFMSAISTLNRKRRFETIEVQNIAFFA
jgi:hypothetical protein